MGVSTVSRAINNHPDINAETKKKVMETIQEHGYIPNNSARNLRRADGKCIAVVVKGISNPLFADAIEIMEEEIKRTEAELEASACDYEKYSALYARKEALDGQLLELMEKWEKLAEEAEG